MGESILKAIVYADIFDYPLALHEIHRYLVGYAASIPAFRILVWAIPAVFLYLLGGHTLYALGQQLEVTRWMGLVGVVNIALNALIIPHWGYLGAAGVAVFSEALLAVLLCASANRPMPDTDT